MTEQAENNKPARKLSRILPAWTISIIIHGLLLLILALVTIIVTRPKTPEPLLGLSDVSVSSTDAGGGSAGGAQQTAEQITPPQPSLAPLPPMPTPSFNTTEQNLQTDISVDSSDPLQQLLLDDTIGQNKEGTTTTTGIGEGFGDYLGGLKRKGLDIVFVLDATGSMRPYIEQARLHTTAIINVITDIVPKARFGIVAYKDYGDDYGTNAVKFLPLTDDAQEITDMIASIQADGGGDLPEPIHEALRIATDRRKMGWASGRTAVIILIGDSPIHPTGRKAAFDLAEHFATRSRNNTINVLDTGGDIIMENNKPRAIDKREKVRADLEEIARKGHGSAYLLTDNKRFWRDLIVLVFGQRFQEDVDAIIDKYLNEE